MLPHLVFAYKQHDNMEHLALMEKCVGHFPRHMLRASPVRDKYFDDKGLALGLEKCVGESRRHIRRQKTIRVRNVRSTRVLRACIVTCSATTC